MRFSVACKKLHSATTATHFFASKAGQSLLCVSAAFDDPAATRLYRTGQLPATELIETRVDKMQATHVTKSELEERNGTTPGPCDVLLGRGRRVQAHAGNQAFRKILEGHMLQHRSCPRKDRVALLLEILTAVKLNGGRFLQRNGNAGQWVEVDNSIAHKKVGQALRYRQKQATLAQSLLTDTKGRTETSSAPLLSDEEILQAIGEDLSALNVCSLPSMIEIDGLHGINWTPTDRAPGFFSGDDIQNAEAFPSGLLYQDDESVFDTESLEEIGKDWE